MAFDRAAEVSEPFCICPRFVVSFALRMRALDRATRRPTISYRMRWLSKLSEPMRTRSLRSRNDARGDARVFHLVHRAGLCVDELFAFFVGFEGPSSRQYAVLSAVARGKGKSQARIVNATGIDRSTTSAMVRRLLRQGWLSRHRAKNDGRAYTVELTASGRKALKRANHAARETDSMLLATVSPRHGSILLRGLRKIIETHSAI